MTETTRRRDPDVARIHMGLHRRPVSGENVDLTQTVGRGMIEVTVGLESGLWNPAPPDAERVPPISRKDIAPSIAEPPALTAEVFRLSMSVVQIRPRLNAPDRRPTELCDDRIILPRLAGHSVPDTTIAPLDCAGDAGTGPFLES